MPHLYYSIEFDGCSDAKYRLRADLPFSGPAPIGTELHICSESDEHGRESFFAYISGYEHYTPMHHDDPDRTWHDRFADVREYGDFYMLLSDDPESPVLNFSEDEDADKFCKFLESHGWQRYN